MNNWNYRTMADFVLRHAAEVLKTTPPEKIRELEAKEGDYQKHGIGDPMLMPSWAIARAQLTKEPGAAEAIIVEAIGERRQRSGRRGELLGPVDDSDRGNLAEVWWSRIGEPAAPRIVTWFCTEEADARGTTARATFFDKLAEAPESHPTKCLVAMIIGDARFPALDDPAGIACALAVNRLAGSRVISNAEIQGRPEDLREKLRAAVKDWCK
jgi:hypothetical protein